MDQAGANERKPEETGGSFASTTPALVAFPAGLSKTVLERWYGVRVNCVDAEGLPVHPLDGKYVIETDPVQGQPLRRTVTLTVADRPAGSAYVPHLIGTTLGEAMTSLAVAEYFGNVLPTPRLPPVDWEVEIVRSASHPPVVLEPGDLHPFQYGIALVLRKPDRITWPVIMFLMLLSALAGSLLGAWLATN